MAKSEIKHWRLATTGLLVQTNFTVCGLRAGAQVEFTSRPRLITCPECRRHKELRAALARQRAVAAVAR